MIIAAALIEGVCTFRSSCCVNRKILGLKLPDTVGTQEVFILNKLLNIKHKEFYSTGEFNFWTPLSL
jgi:hypothetical protein